MAGLLAPELRTGRWLIVSISCCKLLRNLANLNMHKVFGLLSSKFLCLEYVLLSKFSSHVPQRTAFDGIEKTASFSVQLWSHRTGWKLGLRLRFEPVILSLTNCVTLKSLLSSSLDLVHLQVEIIVAILLGS